ncbi:MAG: NAD(P)H-binding protein, partial [Nocardioidaceae bacterium]
VRRGLDGLDVVLMVSAAESEKRLDERRAFVDAAAEAGVRHLVDISFFGASPASTFLLARDHDATEQHIERSGMTWTHLRDNLYADFMPLLADADGVIRGPARAGRVTFSLTGPEAITLSEAAVTMSRVLGRDYSFRDETLDEAYASRSGHGAPSWQVDAWVSTYTAIASGELSALSDDVHQLTGREPRSLADLLAR